MTACTRADPGAAETKAYAVRDPDFAVMAATVTLDEPTVLAVTCAPRLATAALRELTARGHVAGLVLVLLARGARTA
jgi:hypothetical protein